MLHSKRTFTCLWPPHLPIRLLPKPGAMAVSSRSSARSSASSSDDNNKSDSNCKSDSNSNLSGERRQRGESSSGSDSAAIEFPSAAMDKKARQRQHVRRSYYRRLVQCASPSVRSFKAS